MDHATAKAASYITRREVPVGSTVTTTEDAYWNEPIPAGTQILVRDYSNEGFNGIVIWGTRLDTNERVHVSAGIVTK